MENKSKIDFIEENYFKVSITIGILLISMIIFTSHLNRWKDTGKGKLERGLIFKEFLIKEEVLKYHKLIGSGDSIECFGKYKLYRNYVGHEFLICDN